MLMKARMSSRSISSQYHFNYSAAQNHTGYLCGILRLTLDSKTADPVLDWPSNECCSRWVDNPFIAVRSHLSVSKVWSRGDHAHVKKGINTWNILEISLQVNWSISFESDYNGRIDNNLKKSNKFQKIHLEHSQKGAKTKAIVCWKILCW